MLAIILPFNTTIPTVFKLLPQFHIKFNHNVLIQIIPCLLFTKLLLHFLSRDEDIRILHSKFPLKGRSHKQQPNPCWTPSSFQQLTTLLLPCVLLSTPSGPSPSPTCGWQ